MSFVKLKFDRKPIREFFESLDIDGVSSAASTSDNPDWQHFVFVNIFIDNECLVSIRYDNKQKRVCSIKPVAKKKEDPFAIDVVQTMESRVKSLEFALKQIEFIVV